MPLCTFAVGRIVTENQEYHSYGGFVIDTSLNRQDEILNLLSNGDVRRIGVALGIIPHPDCVGKEHDQIICRSCSITVLIRCRRKNPSTGP
jgi:hypothetical protein